MCEYADVHMKKMCGLQTSAHLRSVHSLKAHTHPCSKIHVYAYR